MTDTLSQREFTLGEEEILIRAREAARSLYAIPAGNDHYGFRAGEFDGSYVVRAAAQALRDLAIPLHQLKQERGE